MGKSITDLSCVTRVGLDLAKHVFQVHCVDPSGRVVVAKAIRRDKLLEFFTALPQCLVGLEACGSAHYWARELIAQGHDARMMPPACTKRRMRSSITPMRFQSVRPRWRSQIACDAQSAAERPLAD